MTRIAQAGGCQERPSRATNHFVEKRHNRAAASCGGRPLWSPGVAVGSVGGADTEVAGGEPRNGDQGQADRDGLHAGPPCGGWKQGRAGGERETSGERELVAFVDAVPWRRHSLGNS
jgi:hypothetical protein